MRTRLVETEFQKFMGLGYPGLESGSLQYLTSRCIFYAGVVIVAAAENPREMISEALKDLHFAANQGIRPEDALQDLVESRQ